MNDSNRGNNVYDAIQNKIRRPDLAAWMASRPKNEGSAVVAPIVAQAKAAIKKEFNMIKLIKILCSLILVNTLSVSLYYSFEYLSSRQPTLLALLLSTAIISATVILFDLGVLFIKQGGWSIILGVVLIILGFVSILYSISNTIGGFYNTRSEAQAVKTEDAAARMEYDVKYNALIGQRDSALRAMASRESDMKAHQAERDPLSAKLEKTDRDLARINTLEVWLRNDRLGIAEQEKKVEDLDKQLEALSSTRGAMVVERDDFFTFIANILAKGDVARVEFIMGAFPAVFCDVMSPLMMAVLLFLRKKE